jgi:hypothetical protein
MACHEVYETVGKRCKNKHGASKIIDTLETYESLTITLLPWRTHSGFEMGIFGQALIPIEALLAVRCSRGGR